MSVVKVRELLKMSLSSHDFAQVSLDGATALDSSVSDAKTRFEKPKSAFRLPDLPQTLTAFLLRWLSLKDHLRVCAVNKALLAAATRPSSWEVLDLRPGSIGSNRLSDTHGSELTCRALTKLSYARPRMLALYWNCDDALPALTLMLPTVEELRGPRFTMSTAAVAASEVRLSKLRSIRLSVADTAMIARLGSCENLQSVHIDDFDDGVTQISLWHSILKLPVTAITWQTPVYLSRSDSKALTQLAKLPHLTQLETLERVTNDECAILATFPKLSHLRLRTPKLTDDGLRALSKLPLTLLAIERDLLFEGASGFASLQACPLQHLELTDFDVDEQNAQRLMAKLSKLTTLKLVRCSMALGLAVRLLPSLSSLLEFEYSDLLDEADDA